ncbi:MAG: YIP1 family protein [candidate division WOR-3 bacterium]
MNYNICLKKESGMELFYEIFALPRKAFRRIKENPSWTVPIVGAILLLGLTVIFVVFFKMTVYEYSMMESLRVMAEKAGTSLEDVVRELIGDQDISVLFTYTLGEFTPDMVGAFKNSLLGLLLQSLFLYFVLVRDPKMIAPTLSVVIWSKFPLLIGALLAIPGGALFRNPHFSFSVGSFLPLGSPLALGFGAVDIFSLWSLVLMAMGFSELTGKRVLSWSIIFGLWFGWFLLLLLKGIIFGG